MDFGDTARHARLLSVLDYRPQGWISPVLLLTGRIDGVLLDERRGPSLAVEIEPFTELPAWARRQAEQEASPWRSSWRAGLSWAGGA